MTTGTAKPGAENIKTLIGLLKSKQISGKRKGVIALLFVVSVLYTILPIDIVPDALPVAGMTDDWALAVPAVAALLTGLKKASGLLDVPKWVIVLAFAAASAYVFLPIDVFVDGLPFIGTVDDVTVFTVALPAVLQWGRKLRTRKAFRLFRERRAERAYAAYQAQQRARQARVAQQAYRGR